MSLDEILTSLLNIGLTKPVEEMVVITDEPKIPGYLCFIKSEVEHYLKVNNIFGQGFDINRIKAKVKAVAECLERLCLEKAFKNSLFIGKYNFKEEFIDPALFYNSSDEQSSDKSFSVETLRKEEYVWWPVRDLSGRAFFIPAQLIFLSSDFNDEIPIRRERISTGAAFGVIGNEQAFKAGLFEVIERDAFISAYLTRRDISKIVALPEDISKLVKYLERYQLEPYIFDIRNDLNVPAVLVITVDRTGIGPAINVGARADLNYSDAIRGAILESIQSRRLFRISQKLKKLEGDKINSIDDRLLYWSFTERINDLDFWFKNSKTVSYKDLLEHNTTIEKVLKELVSRKYNIFIADITIPQIRASGFEVVKVIIPELHPLYIDEDAKALYSIHHGTIKDDKTLKPHPFT